MNLILVSAEDFIDSNVVTLKDRRFIHIASVHKAQAGQTLRIGLINGNIGKGTVIAIDQHCVSIRVSLLQPACPPLPVTLILALPRPKMLKRILQASASLGVSKIYLINSYRVDKSYWSSPVLSEASINEHLLLGLEQAATTQLPELQLRKRFKPFVEDELLDIAQNTEKLIAHPYQATPCPVSLNKAVTIVIGPEGGFIDYEVNKLCELGFTSISLGERILRVETAIPFAIAKLFS